MRRVMWCAPVPDILPRVYFASMGTRTRIALFLLVVTAPAILAGQSHAPSALPTPASVFGFEPGADYKLATYDQSIAYFKKLAAASRYVKLIDAGKTSEGRTMYFALISTP